VWQSGARQKLRHITVHPSPSTTTDTGLKVCCEIDSNLCPKGVNVSDREMAELDIKGNAFHPE
jgi:hypothetical protein